MNETEPDAINYVSVPTLKSMATVRVATALNISQCDDFVFGECKDVGLQNFMVYSRFFAGLEEVTSVLPLLTSLKAEVASIIRPIVLQRLMWIRFSESVKFTYSSLYWTNEGTVDIKKTVEQTIMKDSGHCAIKLFQLACQHCIETCFPEIYNRLPLRDKGNFLNHLYINTRHRSLLAYWIYFAKGELPELFHTFQRHYGGYDCNQSIYHNMVTSAVSDGNPMAVKYFWGKLTDDERCSNLTHWVNIALKSQNLDENCSFVMYQQTNDYSDVIFFLLSQITNGIEQRGIFRENSLPILISLFLHWPRQRFLIPTLQVMWDYLDEEDYVRFISLVVKHIEEGNGIEIILREIWHASPTPFRKCFIHYVLHSHARCRTDIWCNLLLAKDMDAIRMLLEEMDSVDRKNVLFSVIRNRRLLLVIYTQKINLFELLVQRTLPTESDVLALKKGVVEEYGGNLCHQWVCDDDLEKVENFFSWAFTSQDQIDEFKNGRINKTKIIHDLAWKQANFELVDKFLNWCFNSQEEVHEFKKRFAVSEYRINQIGNNWDIPGYSSASHRKIRADTARIIKFEYKFVAELIHWYCCSEEGIKEYKGRFVLSKAFLERLSALVRGDREIESLRRELSIFFPLDEGVITQLQNTIRYWSVQGWRIRRSDKELLIRMIQDANSNACLENSAGSTGR